MLNRDEKKIAEWFFNLIGVFCHYSFFTEKLWKKVEGFENEDEAEIIAAFMHGSITNIYATHCPLDAGGSAILMTQQLMTTTLKSINQ